MLTEENYMIKGINKQVLEIQDTGSEYFEKALFFVNPKFSTLSENTLREKAGLTLRNPPKVPQTKKQRFKKALLWAANLSAAAGAGAALTALIR